MTGAMGGIELKSTAIPAAVAAALIISLCTGAAAQAQTPDKPQAQSKPAAKPPAKPKPQAKPAAQPKPTVTPDVPGRKSVCVASALGHKFRVQKVGVMVFGNALEEVATSSWGIDDFAISRIQGLLDGKYTVRRLPLSEQNLNALEAADNGGLLFGGSTAAVSGPLRSAAAATKCDMYLTVTRAGAQLAGTNQALGGLGVLARGSILGDLVYVHAIFNLRTYDSNLTHLRTERASLAPLLVTGLTPPGIYGMYKQVDASWFPAAPQSAVQSAQLKNTVRALVEEGLAKTLKEVL
jgi:hypothetical protein